MTKGVEVRVAGLGSLQKRFEEESRATRSAMVAALFQQSSEIMDDSQKRVPFVTGRLYRSAYVTKPRVSDSAPRSEVGYAAPYAAIVHEKNVSGEDKFLQKAFNKIRSRYVKDLLEKIRRNIRKKTGIQAVNARWSTQPRDPG